MSPTPEKSSSIGSACAGGKPRTPKPFRVRRGGRAIPCSAGFDTASGALTRRVRFRHDPAQHIDEQTRQGKIRPGGVSGHMEQHYEALAAPLGGHERRPVRKTRPSFLRSSSLRLGKHLTGYRHLARSGKAEEWTARLERRDMLSGSPRTKRRPANALRDEERWRLRYLRQQRDVSRKAQQYAAVVEELSYCVEFRAWRDAHVGEDEHGGLLVEQRHDRIGGSIMPFADVGEWLQGPLEIIAGREQRLGDVRACARCDGDPTTARAFVDEPRRRPPSVRRR